jgi:hypothetical protein
LNSGLGTCKAGTLPSHNFRPFYSGYFGDGVLWTIWLDWPQTAILSTSAS